MDQAEEDVLGADVRVVQEACFLLSQDDDPAGPVSESFEHKYRLWGAVDTWAQCTGGRWWHTAVHPRSERTRLFVGSVAPVAYAGCLMAEIGTPLLAPPTIAADRERIDRALRAAVRTEDAYLDELASHLIRAGGKRLRPIVAVLASMIDGRPTASDEAVLGGVACEHVQVGSLYHDDVMDEADTRRGVETVNAKWGNLQAIVAGDFLLARASAIAPSLGTEVTALLADTIGRRCFGQIGE